MRCAGAFANLDQRAQAGVVAKLVIEAGDLRMVDIGDDFELAHAGAQPGDCLVHGVGDNAAGLAHINQFGLGFHQARPVDDLVIVRNGGIWQAFDNMLMRPRGIVMRIQLNSDSSRAPTTCNHQIA